MGFGPAKVTGRTLTRFTWKKRNISLKGWAEVGAKKDVVLARNVLDTRHTQASIRTMTDSDDGHTMCGALSIDDYFRSASAGACVCALLRSVGSTGVREERLGTTMTNLLRVVSEVVT